MQGWRRHNPVDNRRIFMSDIKFSCPQCGQHITCDALWMGQQLPCPACQNQITVPQVQASAPPPAAPQVRMVSAPSRGSNVQGPPPPPSNQSKLSLGRPQPSEAGDEPPSRPKPVYRVYTSSETKKKRGPMTYVTIGLTVVAVGIGGYFGYGFLLDYQEKANAKRREIEKNSDGGQVGHIVDLHQVLEATDPDRESVVSGRSGVPRPPRDSEGAMMIAGQANSGETSRSPEKDLPLLTAIHTLDIATARIPEGRANGMISGTNFVVETARLDVTGTSHLLRLTQGSAISPDREILVYLRPKAGENVAGRTWTISSDMKGPTVPQVVKRWKPNPKFAPQTKPFATGYAMKLELGEMTDGEITGRIFLALPDPEKSVVAGIFRALTTLGSVSSGGSVAPVTAPAPGMTPTPSNPEFEARYGIKR